MSIGFTEDEITVGGVTVFKLFLKVSTAVLIFAEVEEFALEIFNSNACEAVDWMLIRRAPVIVQRETYILAPRRLACSSNQQLHQGTELQTHIHPRQIHSGRRQEVEG
jgi:hypothetical protein